VTPATAIGTGAVKMTLGQVNQRCAYSMLRNGVAMLTAPMAPSIANNSHQLKA
jgi:hypothetical protein